MADLRLGLDLPDGLPPWLAAFVLEAQRETDTLRDNGAEQAAAARTALLKKLVAAAQSYLDTELGAGEAAIETGRCKETIPRAVRDGTVPDRRANPKGRHRARRASRKRVASNVVHGGRAQESAGRVFSNETSEWLYVFKPWILGSVLYVKLVLRAHCVVVSFHKEQANEDEDSEAPSGRA